MNKVMKQACLYYLKNKMSVIPVGKDKKPLINWKEYQNRIATIGEIDQWFETYPDMQIGIVTGKISRIIVVDIDSPDLDLSWLPKTAIVKTGSGGMHYYYSYVEGCGNKARIKDFIDIRGDGGYVVAPPSSNLKGEYTWVDKIQPVFFPKNLFFKDEKNNVQPVQTEYTGFGEGQRNEQMAKYIGHILAKIHPSEWDTIAYPTIEQANQKNTPPLADQELQSIFRSICSTEKRNDNQRWYQKEEVKEPNGDLVNKTNYTWRYTWGTKNLDNNFSIIKRGNFIVLGASSGCIHPDTPIFDPIDKTTLTVKERFIKGVGFNVFSLDKNKQIIVTKAEAPIEFRKEGMVELTNGKHKIIVTPNHRIWDGEKYTKVCELPLSSSFLLPSISDTFLSKYALDEENSFQKDKGSQSCCHSLFRLCDQLLRSSKGIFQAFSPLQDGVHEHNQYYFLKDGQEPVIKYSRFYQWFSRLSNLDFCFQLGHKDEFRFHLKQDTFSPPSRKLSLFFGLQFLFFLIYKVLNIVLFVPLSKVYKIFLSFLRFCSYKKFNNDQLYYSKWELKPQVDEVFYDFTVPKYENYYACGLFHHNSGKTTFAFDMAQKNALIGHKVLFISLEMEEKEIKESLARKKAGITIQEERDYNIPEKKQKIYERKLQDITEMDRLYFRGIRRGGSLKWEDLLKVIYEFKDLDLIFIDNLDLIEAELGEHELDRQKRIVKRIMAFTADKQVPIVLIHHYRKTSSKSNSVANENDLSGSKKIVDGADRLLNISRNRDPEAEYPDKYRSVVYLQKGREYSDAMASIYFIKGTFEDEAPLPDEYEKFIPII